jgi:hypothetical protein
MDAQARREGWTQEQIAGIRGEDISDVPEMLRLAVAAELGWRPGIYAGGRVPNRFAPTLLGTLNTMGIRPHLVRR